MSEPWIDGLARRLARMTNRRDVVTTLTALFLGGAGLTRGRLAGAAQDIECESSSERICIDGSGEPRCLDLRSDPRNCGACGRICPQGTRCAEGDCTGSEEGQPPAGRLSATAVCEDGPRTVLGDELIDVVITNKTYQPVTVIHLASLTGPALPGLPSFVVASGADWSGLIPRTVPDGVAMPGAVITANAGVLVVPCGNTDIPFGAASFAPEDAEQTARIMARTLSILESANVQAFDALFALLHPDAKEVVSYGQLACWYLEYVSTERPAGEATVKGVRIAPWTWGGNGTRYEDAAAVTYRQPFYAGEAVDGPPEIEEREATLHLVQSDGIWHWFFGTDPDWLAQLPESC